MPAGFVSAKESKAQPAEKSSIRTNYILTFTNPVLAYININTTSVWKYPESFQIYVKMWQFRDSFQRQSIAALQRCTDLHALFLNLQVHPALTTAANTISEVPGVCLCLNGASKRLHKV